jgi:hypothetical protein
LAAIDTSAVRGAVAPGEERWPEPPDVEPCDPVVADALVGLTPVVVAADVGVGDPPVTTGGGVAPAVVTITVAVISGCSSQK